MHTDRVIVSSRVFTGTSDKAEALAIGVEDDRIAAVAPAAEADSLMTPGTELVDAGDAFVCAGFGDAHQHVLHAALFSSDAALRYVGTSERDCAEALAAFAASHPGDGWVLAQGWRDYLWDPPVAPTRASLDALIPNRPAALYSGDCHTLWLNTRGLEALGIDDGTPVPSGGVFVRDEGGRLTGILDEAAGMVYFSRILGMLPQRQLEDAYRDYLQRLAAMGITSVSDMAISPVMGADCINAPVYEALLARDELPIRAHLFPTLTDDLSNLEDLQERLGTNPMLRAPGFKQFFDGVSSSHTAWCSELYANARDAADVGRPTIPAERMRELVLAAASRGHPVRIHTIGDRAVTEATHIFAEARCRYGDPTQGRNTLEHVEDIRPQDIDALRDANAVASVQPPHVVIDLAQPGRDLGPERAARMWPFDQFLAAGVDLAFGTDAPVVEPTSTDVLYTAVTRRTPDTHEPKAGWHPEHDITRAQAIRAYTLGSAAAVGRDHELGTIEPGKLADLCIWEKDLLTCTDNELQQARCLTTIVGGRVVHEA